MDYKSGISLDPAIVGTCPFLRKEPTSWSASLFARHWNPRIERAVKKDGNAKGSPLPPYKYKLKLFLDMCEQVYVDCASNRNILGVYTEKARL